MFKMFCLREFHFFMILISLTCICMHTPGCCIRPNARCSRVICTMVGKFCLPGISFHFLSHDNIILYLYFIFITPLMSELIYPFDILYLVFANIDIFLYFHFALTIFYPLILYILCKALHLIIHSSHINNDMFRLSSHNPVLSSFIIYYSV